MRTWLVICFAVFQFAAKKMHKSILLLILLAATSILAQQSIFIVPHSHCDLGWLKTPQQYYEEEVRYIYDAVVKALRTNPSRRFTFVEV